MFSKIRSLLTLAAVWLPTFIYCTPSYAYGPADFLPRGFSGISGDPSLDEATDAILSYKKLIEWLIPFAALTCAVFFIRAIVILGKAMDNPQERKRGLVQLFVSGIAFALLGSIELYIIILWGLL